MEKLRRPASRDLGTTKKTSRRLQHPTGSRADRSGDQQSRERRMPHLTVALSITVTVTVAISLSVTLRPTPASPRPGDSAGALDTTSQQSTTTTPAERSVPATGPTTGRLATTAVTTSTTTEVPGPQVDSPNENRRVADPDVSVVLIADRTSYTGPCPPAAANASKFHAVIAVTAGPVDVQYRWRTSNGGSSHPDWKILRFTGTEAQEQQVSYTDLSYLPDQPFHDWVAVDISEPRQLQSNRVDFSTTCTT